MAVTLLGIIVFMQPSIKVLVAVSIIALHPLRESYMLFPDSTIIEVRLVQPKYLQLVVCQRFSIKTVEK